MLFKFYSISLGINFENELSRAVVIIGVPNLDCMNPRIKIEEKYYQS